MEVNENAVFVLCTQFTDGKYSEVNLAGRALDEAKEEAILTWKCFADSVRAAIEQYYLTTGEVDEDGHTEIDGEVVCDLMTEYFLDF